MQEILVLQVEVLIKYIFKIYYLTLLDKLGNGNVYFNPNLEMVKQASLEFFSWKKDITLLRNIIKPNNSIIKPNNNVGKDSENTTVPNYLFWFH